MLRFVSPPMPHMIVGGEDTYPVGGTHPNRSGIGVFDLIAVTRGELFMEENGQPLRLPAGHYAVLRPDLSHRTVRPCREETHFYWLHFQTAGKWFGTETEGRLIEAPPNDPQPYATIESFSFYLPSNGVWGNSSVVTALIGQLLRLQSRPSAVNRWKQQQLFHELLLQLQQMNEAPREGDARRYDVAERAAAWLREHFREKVGYRELAEEMHFHANYIARCMKAAFGCTPLEYLTRHRVEQAKLLLVHTDAKMYAVAEAAGFGSLPYFVRCFKRHAGMPPKAYREQFRGR